MFLRDLDQAVNERYFGRKKWATTQKFQGAAQHF